MRIGAKTDNGKVREQNEDAYGYHDNLFVLADGMGGHKAGEIASAIAVETILNANFDINPTSPEYALQEAVQKANQAILEEVVRNPGQSGMGTTIAVLYIVTNAAYFTHVGDSRIYRYNGGTLEKLTDDHSLVAELVKNGGLTEAEAKSHPQRNLLTRALGTQGLLEIEVSRVPAVNGDKFLLCSDGLTAVLDEDLIREEISRDEDPQLVAERLVSLANDSGGIDNITVILIEI